MMLDGTGYTYEDMVNEPTVMGKVLFPGMFYIDFAEFHRQMIRELMDSTTDITIVKVPRGFGKSVIISFLLAIYAAIVLQYRYIVIVSASKPKAEQFLSDIRQAVQSTKFMEIFGNVRGRYWSAGQIHIQSEKFDFECIIESVSIFGVHRGLRWGPYRVDLFINDDIEDDDDNLTSDSSIIDRKMNRINKVMLPALRDDGDSPQQVGRIWWLGTPIGRDCAIERMAGLPGIKTIAYACLDKNGNSIWPEKFSTKKLLEKREKYFARGQAVVWWSEYMVDPREESVLSFKGSILKFNPREILDLPIYMRIALDAAYTEKRKSCESALTVGGMDYQRRLFCFDAASGKWNPTKTGQMVASYVEKYMRFADEKEGIGGQSRSIMQVAVESTAFEYVELVLKQMIWDSLQHKISIFPVSHGNVPKVDRAAKLIPFHESDSLLLSNSGTPGLHLLEEQLLDFPFSRSGDDSRDSLAQLLAVSTTGHQPEAREKEFPSGSCGEYIKRRLQHERDIANMPEVIHNYRRNRISRRRSSVGR